jgi:predicted nucleic acid-binding protein
VIVLDTNQLHAQGIEQHPRILMLRAVAAMTGHRLAVPAMVEDEYLGKYRRDVAKAMHDVERADNPARRRHLLRLVPWWLGRERFARGELALPLVDSAVDERQKLLRSIFQVVEPPPNAAEEGHSREIRRQPPAVESGEAGKGGRDTVIWLTALEAAKAATPYNLYFVTRDQGFGGPKLKPELAAEAPRNLVYCDSIDRLLNRLSCHADLPMPSEEILRSSAVIDAVRAYTSEGQFKLTAREWMPASVRWPLVLADELIPGSVLNEPAVQRIGESTLVALEHVWMVRRRFIDVPDGGVPPGMRPPEVTLVVDVPLGIVVVFEDGEPMRAGVTYGGGLRPSDLVEVDAQ